ncbi:MAG: hypothetical protein B7Y40_08060 [Gammaproteobacteria bacterium 28-57-27]|nr:MAG: hypothetical protein B7Y40_08060 [Gammaproteobacteria bacterium 28-57-27]
MRRRVFVLGLLGLGLGLAGCGEPPKVLPQGTLEEQTAQVHTVMQQVIRGLGAGQSRQLIDKEMIFLPSRWRKQAKETEELESLSKSIAAQPGEIELGKVSVAGRWALLESVKVGGVLIGKQDVPWFLFYFAGQWRWMPASILKDPAIEGMMDRNFDRLWGTWQAAHPKAIPHGG